MTGKMLDDAVAVVFVGYLLSKYVASVLIRRLRAEHPALWSQAGEPRVWQLLLTTMGNWRLVAFIWSGDAAHAGDTELLVCVRVIRALDLIVLGTTIAIIAIVFGWHP